MSVSPPLLSSHPIPFHPKPKPLLSSAHKGFVYTKLPTSFDCPSSHPRNYHGLPLVSGSIFSEKECWVMRRIRLGLLLKDESPLKALGVIKTTHKSVKKVTRQAIKNVDFVYIYYIRPACYARAVPFLREQMPALTISYSLR
jgi:hypothetical protein